MPAIQQPIKDYTINFVHNRAGVQPITHARTRFIHLRFGTDPTNLNLLILSFIVDAPSATTGELTKLANGTVRVSAKIPVAEFSAYYDLLRNEQPLSVSFEFMTEPAGGQSIQLDSFTLFSGPEPLGEGPKDSSV